MSLILEKLHLFVKKYCQKYFYSVADWNVNKVHFLFSPWSLQLPFASSGPDDAADNLQQHSHHLLWRLSSSISAQMTERFPRQSSDV